QNYGNFNNDSFTTSGSQTTGIDGYLGSATLIGNSSTYTGTGADPTVLANLQGNGQIFASGNGSALVTGANVAISEPGDGSLAHVVTSDQGVALPTLAPITAATTASVASSDGTGALETALTAAMAGGYVAHLTDATYTVTAPIVINVTDPHQAAFGIDLGGAKIVSQIANGGPVIEIVVGPGVNLSSLTLSNFAINGSNGDGIKIVADGADRGIGTLNIDNVSVEHVDGIGLDVIGNISHGLVANSWMNGNHQGGARFANGPNGGVASGLEWEGGGFRLNGVAGLILDNGTHDMTVKGAYFVDNHGPGIDATSGISLVQESGFENNAGAGAIVQGSANFTDVSFSTWGTQTTAVGGYLDDGKVTLTGVGNEYYGSGADPTVLANIQGSGTVAVSGTGTIVTGTNVTVTGGDPVIDGVPSDPVTTPVVSAGLANDTGGSATDQVTSDAVLVGTAEAGAVVHFTADGNAIAATATADEHGAWSYTPIGLTDGMHTIVASETNAAGTGSASLTFTLDTTAPDVTAALVHDADATTLTGTGDASATVHFTIDGTALAATATADASGLWSFAPTGLAQGAHTVIASETDAAGNSGSASLDFTLQAHPAAPEIAGMVLVGGTVTLSANTAEAGSLVELYDGYTWLGWTRADASGHWSYSASVDPDATHSFGINEFTSAGQVLHGAGQAILGGAADATLTGTGGNDIINANGGNDTVVGGAGADTLTAGAGKATFAYDAASDSTPGAADTITDFKHGIDKIDFTAIAGINAASGVPQFQGNITGSGNLTLEAHSVAFLEAGGNTHVLVNTTNAAETVTASDTHAADMEITLVGVHLGLTSTDFHHS
ncbi:MAG TPA: Ig-like domain-containing protein, partial [Acidothermaceae bacterium]|nr:Ig-like domain-containing protein [Acidothermaceae bacterium]